MVSDRELSLRRRVLHVVPIDIETQHEDIEGLLVWEHNVTGWLGHNVHEPTDVRPRCPGLAAFIEHRRLIEAVQQHSYGDRRHHHQ